MNKNLSQTDSADKRLEKLEKMGDMLALIDELQKENGNLRN